MGRLQPSNEIGTPDTVDCGPDAATINTNDAVSTCEDVNEVASPKTDASDTTADDEAGSGGNL